MLMMMMILWSSSAEVLQGGVPPAMAKVAFKRISSRGTEFNLIYQQSKNNPPTHTAHQRGGEGTQGFGQPGDVA